MGYVRYSVEQSAVFIWVSLGFGWPSYRSMQNLTALNVNVNRVLVALLGNGRKAPASVFFVFHASP
jgi:hypothetical protein